MTRLNVKPTRMELHHLKERLTTAKRGHKLLKDKRDELMRRFICLVRENYRLRKDVENSLENTMKDFLLAKAQLNPLVVDELFLSFPEEMTFYAEQDTIMGVTVPKVFPTIQESTALDTREYSYRASNADMDTVFQNISNHVDKLLRLAEIEKSCQLLADDIEKTRRRVNGLEYSIIPNLEETIHYIELKLEEAERSNLVRIMKVK